MLAFSPDGRRLASGSRQGVVRLWQSGRPIAPAAPRLRHSGAVTALAFSADGRRLVSASSDASLRLWDGVSGQPLVAHALIGHRSRINAVAFSPDGHQLVSGSADRTLRLWDTQTGKTIGPPLQGHTHAVRTVAFSPDGRRLASGSGDGAIEPDRRRNDRKDTSVRLWDPANAKSIGPALRFSPSDVMAVNFRADGSHLLASSGAGDANEWDATPTTIVRWGCRLLQHHQLLLNPERFEIGTEFSELAHRAEQQCRRALAPAR